MGPACILGAVTRFVLDLPCSRLLGQPIKLQSLGQARFMTLGLVFCLLWVKATCKLHNNLAHSLWKHEIHKEGVYKDADVLVGQHSVAL